MKAKNKSLKGISPLVAVIMLIAFTLIMAGILSIWIQGFASERTRAIETCADARALIQSASYNSGAEELTITIYNYGRTHLNFTSLLKYADNVTLDNTMLPTDPRTITSFKLINVSSDLQEITIIAEECQGLQDFLRRIDIKGLGF